MTSFQRCLAWMKILLFSFNLKAEAYKKLENGKETFWSSFITLTVINNTRFWAQQLCFLCYSEADLLFQLHSSIPTTLPTYHTPVCAGRQVLCIHIPTPRLQMQPTFIHTQPSSTPNLPFHHSLHIQSCCFTTEILLLRWDSSNAFEDGVNSYFHCSVE